RFDRATVRTALAKLRGLGILDELGQPLAPAPPQMAWWRDRPPGRRARLAPDWPNLEKYLRGLPEQLEGCYPDVTWVLYFGEARLAAQKAGDGFGRFVRLGLGTGRALGTLRPPVAAVGARLGNDVPVSAVRPAASGAERTGPATDEEAQP